MQPATRRRVKAAAWFVFIMGGSLLLAYARGYRFSPVLFTREGIGSPPAVGALVIRTVPSGAGVFLDANQVDTATPTGLGSVPAGPHTIRVVKEGYRPFEKNLDIVGGQVTDLLNVLLIPTQPTEEIVATDADDAWRSPDNQWLAIRSRSVVFILPWEEIRRLKEPLTRAMLGVKAVLAVPGPSGTLELYWSPRGSAAALAHQLGTPGPPETNAPEIVSLFDLSSRRVRRVPTGRRFVGWTSAGTLVALSDTGTLSALAPDASADRVLAEDISAAALHPRGVLAQQVAVGASEPRLILLRQGLEPKIVLPPPPAPFTFLAVSARGDIAARARDGGLWLRATDDGRWREVAQNVTTIRWSPDGEKLLFQASEFDMHVVNVSEERSVLPERTPLLLVRLSTPLRNVQWFPDSQRILFFHQDILTLADIDPRGGHRVEPLLSINRGDGRVSVENDHSEALVTARRALADGTGQARTVLLRISLRSVEDSSR